MENLVIAKTDSTPEISFDAGTGILELHGESYPENTAAFYAPVFDWINAYLAKDGMPPVKLNIEILYFNSSSSKALMNLFDLLNSKVKEGKSIVVNWIYDTDNESALEYGEEFKEDLDTLPFELVEKNDQ